MLAIHTETLRKAFGSLVAVRDIDLSVEEGQVVGVVGPNGAGKTTLLRMLATLLPPTSGGGTILGHDLRKDYLDVRRRTGFLPDFFNLYNDLRLWECLEVFARAYGAPVAEIPTRIKQALAYVELTEKTDDLIEHLSRGMTQRLGVAALMVCDPALYLLDEPASGLDPKARIQLRRVLKRLSQDGRTIIISSHILSELNELCTHIAIISKGELSVFGTVDEIEKRAMGTGKLTIEVLENSTRAAELTGAFLNAPATVSEGIITTDAPDDPAQVAALNAHLIREGLAVTGLTKQKANLESLFMAISGAGE